MYSLKAPIGIIHSALRVRQIRLRTCRVVNDRCLPFYAELYTTIRVGSDRRWERTDGENNVPNTI